MEVEDSFFIDKAGLIISGTNTDFDSFLIADIKKLIGGRIKVIFPKNSNELEVDILEISLSESLLGKKI